MKKAIVRLKKQIIKLYSKRKNICYEILMQVNTPILLHYRKITILVLWMLIDRNSFLHNLYKHN